MRKFYSRRRMQMNQNSRVFGETISIHMLRKDEKWGHKFRISTKIRME